MSIKLPLLLSIVTLFISCSNTTDESLDDKLKQQLIGSWESLSNSTTKELQIIDIKSDKIVVYTQDDTTGVIVEDLGNYSVSADSIKVDTIISSYTLSSDTLTLTYIKAGSSYVDIYKYYTKELPPHKWYLGYVEANSNPGSGGLINGRWSGNVTTSIDTDTVQTDIEYRADVEFRSDKTFIEKLTVTKITNNGTVLTGVLLDLFLNQYNIENPVVIEGSFDTEVGVLYLLTKSSATASTYSIDKDTLTMNINNQIISLKKQ